MNINEIIDQIEHGLEGVSPGPWACVEVKTQVGRAFRIGAGEMIEKGKGACIIYDDYPCDPDNQRSRNAAHIARCNPDNMWAIIDAYRQTEAENTRLRAALANSELPCVYCTLPKDEWSKCPDGFPGCGRADDAMGCPELGARMEAEEWRERAEAAEAKVARLHEALADLRKTAALLQQNALGCATNHYGQDFQLHGMPGWLVDTAASIERALAAMEATDE